MSRTLFSTLRAEGETEDLTVEDLWLAFRTTGSREDRDRLVLHYTGLVTYVAARVGARMPSGVDYSDLIQSGVIGLMDAVSRFETERGLKFETYAVARIRGAILDDLRGQDWVPRSVRKRARDLDAATESCRSRLGHTPTTAELADELRVTAGALGITRGLAARMRVNALEDMSHGLPGGSLSVAETFADPVAEQPGEALERQADRDALRAALESLGERDRAVVVHSFFDGLTLAQIGQLLGVTESRVSQLRTKALRQLAAHIAAGAAA